MGSTMGSWPRPWGHDLDHGVNHGVMVEVVEVGPQWGRFQHSLVATHFFTNGPVKNLSKFAPFAGYHEICHTNFTSTDQESLWILNIKNSLAWVLVFQLLLFVLNNTVCKFEFLYLFLLWCMILLSPIWLPDFILFLCVQPYFKVCRLGCFSDLLTTQTITIRRGALRFATQISPLLNFCFCWLQS